MPPKGKKAPEEEEEEEEEQGEKADWSHPDAALLEEIEVDAVYDGVVTNVNNFGVFVNFGAVKDALLRVPIAVKRAYKKGMALRGLRCVACDPDAGKVVLQPDEQDLLEPPPKKPPQAKAEAKSVGKKAGGGEGSNKPKKSWDHPEGRSLEEISVGDVFSGTVTNVSPSGVFLDIGLARDARLSVTTKIGRCFRVKDTVPGCTVESFDLERGRVTVVLDDPEAVVKDLPPKAPKERAPKAQSQPEAKSKAKAQPKAKTTPKPPMASREDRILIEELEVGAIVDGTVSNKSQAGLFIDIGCEKDARLNVPRNVGQQFMRGDEVYGMKIESVDLEKNQISVILEDPQLEEFQMPAARAKPAPKPKAKAAAKSQLEEVQMPAARAKPAPKPKEKAAAKSQAQKPGGLPVTRFRPGANADGIVTGVTNQGVYVDIGAVTDGLLKLPRALALQFRVGDEVHGMEVESVDKEKERVILSLEEPALEEPAPQPKPKAKPKAKAQESAETGSAAPRKGGKGKGRGRA